MLSALLRFELRYYAGRTVFIAAAILYFLLGLAVVHARFGSDDIHKNAPYVVAVAVSLLSLYTIFVAMLYCASVVLRDTTSRMDAIIFTTAVQRLHYFLVRFAGLAIAVLFILALSVAGIAAGASLATPETLGPFKPAFFWQPLLVFGVPNVLFSASVLFCTAVLTRNAKAVYAAGTGLFVLYLTASVLGNSPMLAGSALKTNAPGVWPLLADPFGLAAFFGETRGWTNEQRNTQLFRPQGMFLLNRLVWTMFSLLTLTLAYRFFHFRPSLSAPRQSRTAANMPAPAVYRPADVRPQGVHYAWSSYTSQLRQELSAIFRHIPFWVMLVLWLFVFAVELNDSLFSGPYGIHVYPLSGYIAEELRATQPALLLIIFYAAELVFREKGTGMHALIYTTPIRHAAMWAAKSSALAVLIAVFTGEGILLGSGMQAAAGFYRIDVPVYLSLFWYNGIPLLLFALLAVFILTVVRARYAGMLACLAVAGLMLFGRRLGLEHYLLRYATTPRMQYADMNGFGHYAGSFKWYMLYWSGIAAALSVLAMRYWLRPAGKHPRILLACLFLLVSAVTGAYIYRESNVKGRYLSSSDREAWQLAYETQYKALATAPQPVIKKVALAVDLHPAAHQYTVRGSYQLKNETTAPLLEVHIGIDPEVSEAALELSHATCTHYDARFLQYRYRLHQPLQPGDTTSLHFTLNVTRNGFVPFNSEHAVGPNGTYIELEKFVPYLGYNSGYASGNPAARRRAGLPPAEAVSSIDSSYHLVDFTATVSAPEPEQAITTGALQKTWTEGNRRYFTYRSMRPMRFMFALSSARYAVTEDTHRGIQLRVYHQPGHAANVATILQGMKDALDYCSAQFAPYPLPYLTLAEIPHYGGAATAYPGLIFSQERLNFLGNFNDRPNHVYTITAHETAHQWWANMLAPISGPGEAMLTETLAKYTEAMVAEKRHGKTYAGRLLQADNSLYMSMRNSGEPETPLVKVTDQSFVYYQKGMLVMYRLKAVLGEARVNRALQRLLARHAYPGAKAAPAALVAELCREATAAETALVNECLQQVVTYDLSLRVLKCIPAGNGGYAVTLAAQVEKKDAEGRSLPVNDRFDIALYNGADTLYLQQHHITAGETTLNMTVHKKPARAVIDPYRYIPDGHPENNMQELD